MHRRFLNRLIAVVAVAATFATACGADEPAASDTTVAPPPESTTTTEPEPTTTTTEVVIDHAQAYLDMVTPMNCQLAAIDAIDARLWEDGVLDVYDWRVVSEEYIPAVAVYVDQAIDFAEALVAHPWPADVVDTARSLATEVNVDAAFEMPMAQGGDIDLFFVLYDRPRPPSQGNAGVMRAMLGLDSHLRFDPAVCASLT